MKRRIAPVILITAVLALSGCGQEGCSQKDSAGAVKPSAAPSVQETGTAYDTGMFRGMCPAGWTYLPGTDLFSTDGSPDPAQARFYKGMDPDDGMDELLCANVTVNLYQKNITLLDSRGLYENVVNITRFIGDDEWVGFTGEFGEYVNFDLQLETENCVWQATGVLNNTKSSYTMDDADFIEILETLDYYTAEQNGTAGTPTPSATPTPTVKPIVTSKPTASPTPTSEPTPTAAPTPAQHEHSLAAYPAVEPGCETEGHWTYYVCSGCGEVFDYQYQPTTIAAETRPALGHDFVRTGGGAPSCIHPGSKVYNCSRCGLEYIEEIPPAPEIDEAHAWSNYTPDPSDPNHYHYQYCALCGATRAGDLHVFPGYYDSYDQIYHYYTCPVCGGSVAETHSGDPCACGHTGPVG